jgi:hypothetical protein
MSLFGNNGGARGHTAEGTRDRRKKRAYVERHGHLHSNPIAICLRASQQGGTDKLRT